MTDQMLHSCTALAEDILYFAGDLSQVEALGLRLGLELVTSENEASVERWSAPSSLRACLPLVCKPACMYACSSPTPFQKKTDFETRNPDLRLNLRYQRLNLRYQRTRLNLGIGCITAFN